MAKRLIIIALVAALAGCAAIGNITLPSKEEVTLALQALFDGRGNQEGQSGQCLAPAAWFNGTSGFLARDQKVEAY